MKKEQNYHHMGAWALAGIMSIAAVLSAGAATSQQTMFIESEAETGGLRSASFTASIRDAIFTDPTRILRPMPRIEWVSFDPADHSGWQLARSVVRLDWTVTDAFGGIQIYTDNTHRQASPRFVDPTPLDRSNPDSNPAGLLLVEGDGLTSSVTLPMGWSVKDRFLQLHRLIEASDPEEGPETGVGSRYQWFYLLDRQTPAIGEGGRPFINGDPYVTVATHRGIHGAQGPNDFFVDESRTSYIYFMANFTGAAAQTTYRTNRLILEAFVE